MKVTFFRSPDGEETGTETEVKNEVEDPSGLTPAEASWLSSDYGQSVESNPTHDVPYSLCVNILNNGSKDSGKFIVQFLLRGDLSQDFKTGEIDGLEPGTKALVRVPYGPFENKTGTYSLQATVSSPEGTMINASAVYNFTINAD
jgi:hypothetical protein